MSRKNNLIQIPIVNNNNYPAVIALFYLGQGSPDVLDQLCANQENCWAW